MARLLYIEASPRKRRSRSIEIARIFLDSYRSARPDDDIDVLDLWKKDLPDFDGAVLDAKYAILHGKIRTEEQHSAWSSVESEIQRFLNADGYLISLPMWNFSIPYRLKHYLDIIVQPGYTFSYSPEEGYAGMVRNRPVVLICARGGSYGVGTEGEALDHQRTYMKALLSFIGFTDIRTILVEPTLAGSSGEIDKAIERAGNEAVRLASEF